MIVIRSPLRITMAGGGTDLPWWYKEEGGRVISAAINKFIHIQGFERKLDKKIFLSYSKTEICNNVNAIKNDIIRICLKKFNVKSSIEIHSISETPGSSGLGSSGAFTAALIKFLALYKKIKMCRQRIADLACDVEMKSLKKSSGKQDAFISVFGGFQEIIIDKNGNVKIKRISIARDKIKKLQLSTLTYFTGISRNSESILKKQKRFFHKRKTKFIYKKIANLTEEIKKSLVSGNFNKLGQNFHKHWQYKKKLSSNMSNSFIDKIYSFGIKNGAIGGKIIGAGGGGFLLFIVNPKNRKLLKKKFKKFKLKEFDWKFNSEGIRFSKL